VKPDISGTSGAVSGRTRSEETQAFRDAGAWNPRRSLVARLLWYVVPVALVPAAVYWLAADRIGREQQQSIRATLLSEARLHEEQALSEAAADRLRQIAGATRDVVAIAHRAAEHARRALEDGPDPKLPAEPLVVDASGLLHTTGHGVSAAMVSRATGLGAQARGSPSRR
jgi:hypothetical protein